MTAISIIYWILVVSACLYLGLILFITTGWFRLRTFSKKEISFRTKISVVVAVRNEEENIVTLLDCFENQDYPKELTEIIIVNDHSEDNTAGLVNDFIQKEKLNLKLLNAFSEGKKSALFEGINLASGELILTTDGDCKMSPEWIGSMVSFFEKHRPVLIIGPVVYHNEKTILQKLFSLEFMSLVASGAASNGHSIPFMGNAANLAFTSEAYKFISGEIGAEKFTSGDDVFLIHKMIEKFGSKQVQFIKAGSALVFTKAPDSVNNFLSQRTRWASKAKAYKNWFSVAASLIVLFFNLMLTIAFLGSIYRSWFLAIYFLFVLFKFLLDLPLLYEFTGFVGKRKFLPLLFPFEFIYPFYIVFSAFKGLFVKFEWKGRSQLR